MKKFFNNITVLFLVISLSVYWIAVMCVVLGKVNISYQGFAIDSKNNIYIGYDYGVIKKYKGKNLVGTISAQTSRGYDFTILENDIIYVDCGDKAHYIDLNGNVLETITKDIPKFTNLRTSTKEFITIDGTIYRFENSFGRTKIIEYSNTQKKIVYEMPLLNFLVKTLVSYGTLLFIITVIVFIRKYRDNQGKVRNHGQSGDGSMIDTENS